VEVGSRCQAEHSLASLKPALDSQDFTTQDPRNTQSAKCDFQPLLRRRGFHVTVNLTVSSIVILTNWGLAREDPPFFFKFTNLIALWENQSSRLGMNTARKFPHRRYETLNRSDRTSERHRYLRSTPTWVAPIDDCAGQFEMLK
jgi:hypothetical protein